MGEKHVGFATLGGSLIAGGIAVWASAQGAASPRDKPALFLIAACMVGIGGLLLFPTFAPRRARDIRLRVKHALLRRRSMRGWEASHETRGTTLWLYARHSFPKAGPRVFGFLCVVDAPEGVFERDTLRSMNEEYFPYEAPALWMLPWKGGTDHEIAVFPEHFGGARYLIEDGTYGVTWYAWEGIKAETRVFVVEDIVRIRRGNVAR